MPPILSAKVSASGGTVPKSRSYRSLGSESIPIFTRTTVFEL